MSVYALNEIAATPKKYTVNPGKDFTRNRKMGFHDTLLMLLTMEADCIKEELYRYFGRNTDAPSKAAFYKQRRKLNNIALANLLYTFNSRLTTKLYNGKYQFIACDGSAADIFRNSDDPDTFFEPNGKSTRGFNQVHINAFYSILDRRFTNLVIQPGRKRNEYAAFCEMVDSAPRSGSPTVYFADMGYASYNNFAHVIENGQFFLIRCNDKRLKGILGHPVDRLREMDCRVERILTRTQAAKKRTRPALAERYRHICRSVPMDYIDEAQAEYDITLRIVRFEIMPGIFENIITNLSEREFDFHDFKELYHLRWKEENSFRDLKHPLCLKAFHTKKYEYIVQEIGARAILHNFCTAIISGVDIGRRDTKYEYQVNFAEAFKTCRDFLRIHDGKTEVDMDGLIAQNIEAIRPGRTFARQHRFKLPISFCYRN
ncbi:IS4 family transposase [Enterocloster bolteae]|uniref:IS4 family transposase n=1 Tax=Enterocloster bolteae TaxID=208479 RepID=UPI00210ABBC1|nr:IS4 family transposase [Enterocloster bolteae]MCQ5146268.1 IS4 family transposase [Enterocloster bolteae]